jgi:hypothetical protein
LLDSFRQEAFYPLLLLHLQPRATLKPTLSGIVGNFLAILLQLSHKVGDTSQSALLDIVGGAVDRREIAKRGAWLKEGKEVRRKLVSHFAHLLSNMPQILRHCIKNKKRFEVMRRALKQSGLENIQVI